MNVGCIGITLPETNIFAPENVHPKRKVVFQPPIFRCENASFREGNLYRPSFSATRNIPINGSSPQPKQ